MTIKNASIAKFAGTLDTFKIIAITHRSAPLDLIGKLHLDEAQQTERLAGVKARFELDELMFLSTCNRVEIIVKASHELTPGFLQDIFQSINPRLSEAENAQLQLAATVFNGKEALTHLFEVASSLDSLVVGEREIITQVRKAYEFCHSLHLTGDTIRLVMRQTIETAKQVFTQTDIAKNPVSVVSLAYRRLRDLGIKNSDRIVFVGAGETNTSMAKYLKKHQYANFTVFNRTLSKAEVLAADLNGEAFELKDITSFDKGFDVLITCTASSEAIITDPIYQSLLGGERSRKVVIDLAIPADMARSVVDSYDISYIDVESLKQQAAENLAKREKETEACRIIIAQKVEEFGKILRERRIELAFGDIPKQLRTVKETALNEVFAKEIDGLDTAGKDVLDKVLQYMEKKYNAIAMKTAKEALLSDKA